MPPTAAKGPMKPKKWLRNAEMMSPDMFPTTAEVSSIPTILFYSAQFYAIASPYAINLLDISIIYQLFVRDLLQYLQKFFLQSRMQGIMPWNHFDKKSYLLTLSIFKADEEYTCQGMKYYAYS